MKNHFLNGIQTKISDIHIAVVYVAIIVVYFIIERIWSLRRRQKNLKSSIHPSLNIRNICGISMMTAMNIALIISISLLSNQMVGIFFRVYPGARFLIENILVKLGGLFFGPLIGIFIGFATDLLTIIFTASVLNYGYFFGAIMSGFLGGVIHMILKIKDPSKKTQTIITSIFSLIGLAMEGVILIVNANPNGKYSAKILNQEFSIHWTILFAISSCLVGICIGLLGYSTFAINNLHNPTHNSNKWIKWFANRHLLFLILLGNCGIYMMVDIISLPVFDIKLSSLPYEHFLVGRVITSVPFLFTFTFLIHYIYKLHNTVKKLEIKEKVCVANGKEEELKRGKKFISRLMI